MQGQRYSDGAGEPGLAGDLFLLRDLVDQVVNGVPANTPVQGNILQLFVRMNRIAKHLVDTKHRIVRIKPGPLLSGAVDLGLFVEDTSHKVITRSQSLHRFQNGRNMLVGRIDAVLACQIIFPR